MMPWSISDVVLPHVLASVDVWSTEPPVWAESAAISKGTAAEPPTATPTYTTAPSHALPPDPKEPPVTAPVVVQGDEVGHANGLKTGDTAGQVPHSVDATTSVDEPVSNRSVSVWSLIRTGKVVSWTLSQTVTCTHTSPGAHVCDSRRRVGEGACRLRRDRGTDE